MKIRKLEIKGYKIFDDLKLDFTDEKTGETLNTIVLAGINGTGKTSILNLIKEIFSKEAFIQNRKEALESEANFFGEAKIKAPIDATSLVIEIEFHNYEHGIIIHLLDSHYKRIKKNTSLFSKEIVFANRSIVKKLERSNIVQLKYETEIGEKGKELIYTDFFLFGLENFFPGTESQVIDIPSSLDFSQNFNTNEGIEVLEKRIRERDDGIVRTVDFRLHKVLVEKYIANILLNAILKNRDRTPRAVLNDEISAINNCLLEMNMSTKLFDINENQELLFKTVNGKTIGIEALSNGEQQLFYKTIYLSKLDLWNSILTIDEPEISFHPTWQKQILSVYQNIGENNQVFTASHSPHLIASTDVKNIYLLEIKNNQVVVSHPKYIKGHSINYVLEVMGADYRDTHINDVVSKYLGLLKNGLHETEDGLALKAEIDKLDPESEEARRVHFSIRKYEALNKRKK